MGAAISSWLLASKVAASGQLGVVSGTALDIILARRLQKGDEGGFIRKALESFPDQDAAKRIIDKYFIKGGKDIGAPFKDIPMFTAEPSDELLELTIAGNFVEVFLAKLGHSGEVGINYLEKIQLPNLASLYGAMLAGVDYVLMGAGIPREIPGILDKLAGHEDVSLTIAVEGASGDDLFKTYLSPLTLMPKAREAYESLKRPKFLAIIASIVLALNLKKKSTGKVDGFVIERPTAGGHNAMPRGPLKLDEKGEPIYGPKDVVDTEKVKSLGLPFWLAGLFGSKEGVKEALGLGAAGVQVGTAFAFCEESGLEEGIKKTLVNKAIKGEAQVFTDPKASPTGFPFKAVSLEGSNSDEKIFKSRKKICDLGYLRHVYKRDDGALGYRCPSEPVEAYVNKGGEREDTVGRKCLCNGLMANIGLPQVRKDGYVERPYVTAGEDFKNITRFIPEGKDSYSAVDVLKSLQDD
jgi:nitronate monooxygenase